MRPATRHLLLDGLFGVGWPAGNLLGGEMAGAAFDFINMDMLVRGAYPFSGNPNDKLTYTSPSTKWVRNSAGVYVSGTTLRTDYLANGTALGLLIEGQFTNVLLRSQEFDNAAWTKTDITVTANATTSPDGTANADLLTEGTAGTAVIAQTGTATTASAAVAGSIFLKASANITWARVSLSDTASGTGVVAWINLSTGAIGTVSVLGTATSTGAQTVAAANGFWRLEMWATFQSGVSGARMRIQSASADGGTTRVNNAAYYAWQASAGLGARPSSPVVTTSAAVTRASDDITLLLSQTPFSATNNIIDIRARTAAGTGLTQPLWQIDDGTANNRIRIERDSTGKIRCIVTTSGVEVCNLDMGSVANDTNFHIVFAWAAGDFAASLNGGTIVTDASGALPSGLTTERFGGDTGTDRWDSTIRPWRRLPRAKTSNSEIVTMAAAA